MICSNVGNNHIHTLILLFRWIHAEEALVAAQERALSHVVASDTATKTTPEATHYQTHHGG